MTPLPVSGTQSGTAPADGSKPASIGDRREMERFGLMLWLALSGPARAPLPGLGTGTAGTSTPNPRGADPASDRSLAAPSARTASSRTATTEALISGGEPRNPESSTGAGSSDRSRATSDRAARDGSAEASRPAEKTEGRTPPAQAATAESARTGRGAEGAGTVRVVRGVSAAAEGVGRNQAVAAYRALVSGTGKGAAAPAANTAAFTKLLQAQAARLAGTATRGNGALSFSFRDALGAQGRVRLTMRAGVLQTTIVSPNSETVRSLGTGIGELRGALARHGFADSQITVREARPQDIDAPKPDPQDESNRDRDGQPQRRRGDDTPSGHAGRTRVADEED